MGTSNPFNGGNNRNPLVPDWVGGPGLGPPPPGAPAPGAPGAAAAGNPGNGNPGGASPGGGNPGAAPPGGGNPGGAGEGDAPVPNRFQSARTNFFKFAKSGGGGGGEGRGGGTNRNLRRSVRSFVGKSSGGARRATQRMAAERSATASLGRILSTAGTAGIQETVRRLGFAQLAALPVRDIYAALVDVICEPGGELDESFAREAYIKALAEISEARPDLERPSPETTVSFLASFITNAIQNRLLNAVGNKVVAIPRDVASVQNVEQQINDYIRGKVNDAITEAGEDFPVERIVSAIDDIYERSVVLLEGPDQEGPNLGADDDFEAEAHEEIA
ncbi:MULTISPECIES: Qat anti-phage system associated protein QatB [unclassified Bradyrhizobium]|uniref:Qat anti-phage system associated protein QatB n=1 Tax=unclassified Bradyrhizobium TaxID=2631580 RepID=UPI002916496D|nr:MULTISPECIES: Qat anti-phage system associated protein QatB [unclassified Bradyrhizobium]